MSGGRECREGTVVITRKQCWDSVRGGPRLETSRKNCQRKLLENKRVGKIECSPVVRLTLEFQKRLGN